MGINSCIRRARELVSWPGMSADIRQMVESCETCSAMADRQSAEPLFLHDVPSRPWEKVATDLFTVHGRNYLLTVDFYSNFFEVDYLGDDMTSEAVITKLKHHFARHGVPDKVHSDGGPQYSSEKFRQFSEAWGFQHDLSSPGNSRSNGCAEAHVKIAKKLMKKCAISKEDPYLGLLNLRNTPTEGLDTSPAQRSMGRRTKTIIPTTAALLEPKQVTGRNVKAQKENQRMATAERHASKRTLPPLQEGDNVRMQPIEPGKELWQEATVTKKLKGCMYEVVTPCGRKQEEQTSCEGSGKNDTTVS